MKSVGAVLAGWACLTVLVVIGTAAAAVAMLGGSSSPTVPYLVVNLVCSAAAAALGGWVTARLAPAKAHVHVGVLASIVAALGVLSAVGSSAPAAQPAWYGWAVAALGVTGILVGGAVRARGSAGGVGHRRTANVG